MTELHTLYYLTDYCEEEGPLHEPTIEGIRDFLTDLYADGEVDPEVTQFAAMRIEPLARVEATRSATGEWQTHPTIPPRANFFALIDGPEDFMWEGESILAGSTLDDMLSDVEEEAPLWLLCARATFGLTLAYHGTIKSPEVTGQEE